MRERRFPSFLKTVATPVLIVYWLALFVGTHIPNPHELIPTEVSDKVLHVVAYFGLYSLAAFRIRVHEGCWPDLSRQLLIGFFAGVYGIIDEVLQSIPALNRTADWKDWLADVGGILTAFVVVFFLRIWGEPRCFRHILPQTRGLSDPTETEKIQSVVP